tara:strand:- start:4141 stop:4932 length:792 start_codon:yes stop_codon:yes gene_type:complete
MRKIKVSHEVPLSMMELSRTFNDYDYALVHLFEGNVKYFGFFKDSLNMGREVILDNSAFELGESFEMSEYAYWISKLQPTTYIIPDVLGNAEETLNKLDQWNEFYGHLFKSKKMGVVQGSTVEEVTACYKAMVDQVDEIAICFHYPFYEQTDMGKMIGRQDLIDTWIGEGVIDYSKPHHLLGCSLPQEFKHYCIGGQRYDFIKSLDTSNPIVHGLEGICYNNEGELFSKEKIKLVDLLYAEPSPNFMKVVLSNVEKFKKSLET